MPISLELGNKICIIIPVALINTTAVGLNLDLKRIYIDQVSGSFELYGVQTADTHPTGTWNKSVYCTYRSTRLDVERMGLFLLEIVFRYSTRTRCIFRNRIQLNLEKNGFKSKLFYLLSLLFYTCDVLQQKIPEII